MSDTIEISIDQVPDFLKTSALIKNITVPKGRYIKDIDLKTDQDFFDLLYVLDYWQPKYLPYQVYEYLEVTKARTHGEMHHSSYKREQTCFWKEACESLSSEFTQRLTNAYKIIMANSGPKLIISAINSSNLDLIVYFMDMGYTIPVKQLEKQIFNNNPEFEEYLIEKYPNSFMVKYILKTGFKNRGYHYQDSLKKKMQFAIHQCDLKEIKRLEALGTPLCASSTGRLLPSKNENVVECLSYLLEKIGKVKSINWYGHDRVQRADILKFLIENNIFTYKHFYQIVNFSKECLNWIFNEYSGTITVCEGIGYQGRALIKVIQRNDLDILKLFISNGLPAKYPGRDETQGTEEGIRNKKLCNRYLHNGACNSAVAIGNIEMLKYLRSLGCEWGFKTYTSMLSNQNIFSKDDPWIVSKLLHYLYNNDCPWDINFISSCKTYGLTYCINFARKNGCPEPKEEKTYSESISEYLYG